MKQLLVKTTQEILFALILLLSLSIGIIAAKEATAMAIARPTATPIVTGILTRVDQKQTMLVVKLDTGEAALYWNNDSVFLLDNKATSATLFTKKAMGKRVEIIYQPEGESKKVILNARILP